VTTYNALRNSGARPGDTVAVQGIGGLGQLGIQYAARMGFRTIAISRSEEAMAFSALTNVRPRVEVFKLDHAEQAFNKMMENRGRFRAVLTP
jgi:D-arabinose 1-dehydrogenase-like Zn-dependent alcohol dehydrogenase